MKTVIDLQGNEIQVSDDTMCKPGVDGGLPRLYTEQELDIIFSEQAQNESEALASRLLTIPKQLRQTIEDGPHFININDDVVEIFMDLKTEIRLNSAIKSMQEFNIPTQGWKAENGYFDLTLSDFLTITGTISAKISKAFIAEDTLTQEIQSGTITTIEAATARFNNLMEQ